MNLPVNRCDDSFLLADLFNLRPMRFEFDWQGHRLAAPVFAYFALTENFLFFGGAGSGAPHCDAAHQKGDFVEGLWNCDVVELFLGEDDSGRYQEFNLSPAGAWWSAAFADYRAPESGALHSMHIEVISEVTSAGWKVGMSVPREEMAIRFKGDSFSRANICGVIGEATRCYFSYGKLQSLDFHRSAEFPTLA